MRKAELHKSTVTPVRSLLVLLLAVVASLGIFAGQAQAAPGAYKVLLVEAFPELPERLKNQILAFPDVVAVELASSQAETPTAAKLAGYDVVVSIGDNSYLDRVAWGNSLADYVDSGGVVVQAAYDNWEEAFPQGRFESGGYAPFIPGDNDNNARSLGAFNALSPLMQGITALNSSDNTTPTLAPGASLVASWNDGGPAIAVKGRVVSVSAFIGDHYGEAIWSGDYGRLVVNAVRSLGRQVLTVSNSKPNGGTVTSSAGGIECGALCKADFLYQTPVALTAKAKKGFAFAGFSGSCTGKSCSLIMDAAKSVTASFTSFKPGKVRLNKEKGTAQLTVAVSGPGKLLASGQKVKKRSKSAKKAGKVTVPIVPKGKAAAALKSGGKAKVKVKLAFTPTGGVTATLTKSIVLKLADG